MSDTREKLKQIKKAIRETYADTLDFERTKDEFLLWLFQFKFPYSEQAEDWEEYLEFFPDQSPDSIRPTEGIKLRFLLKLYTIKHRYVISVIECFGADAKGVGIIAVHVNMDEIEYSLQKSIELTYKNSFNNSLKPSQTLFVESFKTNTFLDSLNSIGIAIFGNELTSSNSKEEKLIVKHDMPLQVSFPESDEDK